MRQVVIVAPEFPPNNLVGVHRNRFIASHLEKFGYKPTILTVKSKYYKEKLDPELLELLPKNLKIIKTKAFKPNKIIGDTSIRCFFQHWFKLRKLAKKADVDFIFISLFPAYSTIIGRLIYEEFKIPYCIDYQDPWVNETKHKLKILSKAWLSQKIALFLEPIAVKKASILMSVSKSTLTGVIARNSALKKVKILISPIGFDPEDFKENNQLKTKADSSTNEFTFTYAGVMPEKLKEVLSVFLESIRDHNPKKVTYSFIGTGKYNNQKFEPNVESMSKKMKLEKGLVKETAHRIPYTECLESLSKSDAILVIGSTEEHYTASKIFPAVFSKKPVFAILHEKSSAAKILKESMSAEVVTFKDLDELKRKKGEINKKLNRITRGEFNITKVNYKYFNQFTAESSAKLLAKAIDEVIQRKNK